MELLKAKVTPKDFFLWSGAIITLYVSVVSLITLLFNYIDIAFPDALTTNVYNYDPYSSGIRFAMASLIVLFPLYLVLIHFIRRDITHDHSKSELWVRRWGLILTLFLAIAAAAIDLITLVNTYLSGEITTHFILKVIVVLLAASGVFMHYLADLWGYWNTNPRYAQSIGVGVFVLIILTIIAGFLIIGSPTQIRLYRFDDQKVSDLQTIQQQVISYWQYKGTLPAHLTDLSNSINGIVIPVDSQSNTPYTYMVVNKLTFELCATFNDITQTNSPDLSQPAVPTAIGGGMYLSDSWIHSAGHSCFVRTIDPQQYPVTPSAASITPAKVVVQ